MIFITNSKFKKTKFGSGKNVTTFIVVEPNRNEDKNEKVCVCNWKKNYPFNLPGKNVLYVWL